MFRFSSCIARDMYTDIMFMTHTHSFVVMASLYRQQVNDYLASGTAFS